MDPMTMMVLLGIALMFGASLAFMVPCYLGVWAGLYCMFEAQHKPNPMPQFKYEPQQVWDQLMIQLHLWQNGSLAKMGWMEFVLPLCGPAMIGALTGLAASYGVIRYSVDIFRVTD